MRVALITTNTKLYSVESLLQVLAHEGHDVHFLNPKHSELTLNPQIYDASFNRMTSLLSDEESEEFFLSGPSWGLEVNEWQLKRKWSTKYKQFCHLSKLKLHPVPSLQVKGEWNEEKKNFIETWCPDFSDWVIKPNRGLQGRGVNHISSRQNLYSWLETFHFIQDQDWVIQPFLKDVREYRVLLLKNEIYAVIEKKKDFFKGNYHQGTSGRLVSLSEMPLALKSLSEKLLQHDWGFTCGIDLLLTSKEEVFVLEINLTPGFELIDQLTHKSYAKALVQKAFSCLK
jgi:hypothetical protein